MGGIHVENGLKTIISVSWISKIDVDAFYPVSSKASIWEDKLLNDTDTPPVLWKVIFTA